MPDIPLAATAGHAMKDFMMTESPDLKPCPFCGSENLSIGMQSPAHQGIIRCDGCGATVLADDEAEAIDSWNRRALRAATPVAYISRAGLKNWLSGQHAEGHVLLRDGGELRVPLYADMGCPS